jgi:hypothetical protein
MEPVMPVCPACSYENSFGALICARCYALLVDMEISQSGSTMPPAAEQEPKLPVTRLAITPELLGPHSVAFYINRSAEPLIVDIPTQAILGRNAEGGGTQPRIDLTPYGAFERGLSRMHAIIRRTDNGMSIEDLASSNGSWLNGTRLQPYTPNVLKSGDHLQIGHMHIEVHFKFR